MVPRPLWFNMCYGYSYYTVAMNKETSKLCESTAHSWLVYLIFLKLASFQTATLLTQ